MERKWFGPPLFGRGNNAEEMVWASIIWAITTTTTTSTIITTAIAISIEIARLVLAGRGEIMDGKWFGPPLFWAGWKNKWETVWVSVIYLGGEAGGGGGAA